MSFHIAESLTSTLARLTVQEQKQAKTAAFERSSIKVSQLMISARMNPRSKSVWMIPAACGALVPRRIVHARHSFSPAVKYVMRSSSE